MPDEYWNHNTAYHRWTLRVAAQHRGSVLDVGCGEGLLVQRLARVSRTVVGIDVDDASLARARARLAAVPNARVERRSFDDVDPESRFDVVTFVASIHHLDLGSSLARARSLLSPGGDLLVVGLAANSRPVDWVLSGLALPAIRLGSWLHRETADIGVPVAEPREDLRQIVAVARRELPGVRVRRGLYYRYLLRWTGA